MRDVVHAWVEAVSLPGMSYTLCDVYTNNIHVRSRWRPTRDLDDKSEPLTCLSCISGKRPRNLRDREAVGHGPR